MTTAPGRRARRRELRGNVALITALVIVMLCGFAALAVDVGNMYRVRSEARSGLDAAALAGATGLNGMTSGFAVARARAIAQAAQHRVYRGSLQLSQQQVELGNWAAATGFTATTVPRLTNAVRIIHQTEPVTHPFGAVLGSAPSPIGARAVALGGGPTSAPCAFPLVVPDCALRPALDNNNGAYCMRMQDNNSDTVGWTAFGNGAVNPNTIRDAIAAACPAVTPAGQCSLTCSNQLNENNQIRLNNGNLMNVANNNFCPLIQSILRRNGSPESFRVTVPVLQTDSSGQCNPQFSGTGTVAGFAEMTIFGARCGNNDAPVIAPNPTPAVPCDPPPGTYLLATLSSGARSNALGGGQFFGLQGRPRLVQ